MSRMLCKCGGTMGTSLIPSPYSLSIYYEQEVKTAISDNPKIRLIDFLTDWDAENEKQKQFMNRLEAVEYWTCPKCNRVYETQLQIGGHWLRVYRSDAPLGAYGSSEEWKRIYVFKEADTDMALEEHPSLLLSDYLKKGDTIQYFLSPDEEIVVGWSAKDQKAFITYKLEEKMGS